MTEDPKTEEMRIVQGERAEDERRRAAEADDPEAVRAHERRADKADYLREKLDEQAESQRP
jgi:hypothetical protein